MRVYIYDPDKNEILEQEVGDIANLDAFNAEMGSMHEAWADNPEDLEDYIDWNKS